ncbi:MAG: ion transporter [Candidatus Eisenbacteria bacterium]|uniref:Ion transporter n=1 Tax=Eiseniibacteriota bacterium TaxID=2212470 RepID=A0A7Y2E6T9_UNCEI|nr:ion transporter [Candidatus Eisenbacteria bacterium]
MRKEEEKTDYERSLRGRLHEIIFEADTPMGKAFDVALILFIIMSVMVVLLESVEAVREHYGYELYLLEWFFTIVFSIEYVLRLYSLRRPHKYATSFFGVVDLLAVLPTYLDLILPGSRYLLTIRFLRVLRIFRVLKLVKYIGEAGMLSRALLQSFRKITIFLFVVLTLVTILGSLMYVIEGQASGFSSIPKGIYWAIITLTTVGYGDITPATPLGQTVAAFVMILGYSIIAVPTGIVSAEMAAVSKLQISTQSCPDCSSEGHDLGAKHCKNCGAQMSP